MVAEDKEGGAGARGLVDATEHVRVSRTLCVTLEGTDSRPRQR